MMKTALNRTNQILWGISSVFALACATTGAVSSNEASGAQEAVQAAKEQVALDIVDTAASQPTFSTLVAAIKAAELVDALKGEGPFTVFAPSNDAFLALPTGTLEELLKPENKEKLQEILKYHVVSGKVQAGDIADGISDVTTLQGGTLTVEKSTEGVMVNSSKVVQTDIQGSNGVIHVIDAVILPKSES